MRFLEEIKTDIRGKRVLVRVGWDISQLQGNQKGHWRIEAADKTISFLAQRKSRIILATHIDRPGGVRDSKLATDTLARAAGRILGRKIEKVDFCVGREVKERIQSMKESELLLLENLRFYKGEERGDVKFAERLASLADIFVNEAFSVSHRNHASISGVPRFLPSFAGFHLKEEISVLGRVINRPEHPLTLIIGGVKAKTKLSVLKRFLSFADYILIGGAVANLILYYKGVNIGRSLIDKEAFDILREIDINNPKIRLPGDFMVESGEGTRQATPDQIRKEDSILDIGPQTAGRFKNIINLSKMLIWNGPMGFVERKAFVGGTSSILEAIKNARGYSIVGGGDTVEFVQATRGTDGLDFVSTGGGAMLQFLAGKTLPGLKALE